MDQPRGGKDVTGRRVYPFLMRDACTPQYAAPVAHLPTAVWQNDPVGDFPSWVLPVATLLVGILIATLINFITQNHRVKTGVALPILLVSIVGATILAIRQAQLSSPPVTVSTPTAPTDAPAPAEAACVYDVKPGISVPIINEGSITQKFLASAVRIDTISVIIGIDKTIADPRRPHPVDLRVQSDEEHVDQVLSADDINDNKPTWFDFPEPLQIKNRNALISMRIINKSQDPVGIYIKRPDDADTGHPQGGGVFIVGHFHREKPYLNPDYVLTACVKGSPR